MEKVKVKKVSKELDVCKNLETLTWQMGNNIIYIYSIYFGIFGQLALIWGGQVYCCSQKAGIF